MADPDPQKRREFARLGGHTKVRNDAVRNARYDDHAEYCAAIVAEWPPLTEVQRARLAAILLSGRRPDRGAA